MFAWLRLDRVGQEAIEDGTFHYFTADASKARWTIVSCFVMGNFLIDSCFCGGFPVFKYFYYLQGSEMIEARLFCSCDGIPFGPESRSR